MQLAHDPAISPRQVLFREAEDQPPPDGADAWPTDRTGHAIRDLLLEPASIGVVRDDAEDGLDVVVEFASDTEQRGPVLRTQDRAVAGQFLAEHPDLGIPAGVETLE